MVPVLPVQDLQKTIDFYKDKLGFYNEWLWGENAAGLERDYLRFIFKRDTEFAKFMNSDSFEFALMVFVTGIDHIYKEYQTNGVEMITALEEKPWGMKEFVVKDVNGYLLRFAERKEEEE